MKKLICAAVLFTLLVLSSAHAAGEVTLGQLIQRSKDAYSHVKDYSAVFYKKERSGNGLGEAEEIFLKFEAPFKIFMSWLNTAKKGLQVVYERGKHGGKLAIHKPGLLLGLAPVVFLDQNSPWVREGSASYDIEDAGIGTFLNDFSSAVSKAEKEGKLLVQFLGAHDENGLKGNKVEVTFQNTKRDEVYFAYRIIVIFEDATGLPTGMTLYDWENQLIGIYEYRKLCLNTGLDEAFKREINRHLYRVYKSGD